MEIVLNDCCGGFSLSEKALKKLLELGLDVAKYSIYDKKLRTDKRLIHIVKELGEEANGSYSKLRIDKTSDYIEDFKICDSIGVEWLVYDNEDCNENDI